MRPRVVSADARNHRLCLWALCLAVVANVMAVAALSGWRPSEVLGLLRPPAAESRE